MRRYVYLSVPLLAFGLMACEDGPNQTYSPATGTLFNSGDTLAVTDDASAPLDAMYSGTSKQEVCAGSQLQSEWAKMVQMPIAPPRFEAGLDLAGGDKYPGLTIQQATLGPLPLAETTTAPSYITGMDHPDKLCQYTVDGVGGDSSDVGGSLQVHWGNNSEVAMEYATPTQKVYILYLNPGYNGHMKWTYTPKTDVMTGAPNTTAYDYDFAINQTVLKTPHGSGQPGEAFSIDWANSTLLHAEIDELYRGIVSNFAPDIYQDTPTDCNTNGTCLINQSGNQDGTGRTVIGFRPAAFYMQTYNPDVSAKLGNTMAATYTFNVKYAPYSVSYSYQTLLACPFADPISGKTLPCPFDQSNAGPLYGSTSSTTHDIPGLDANNGPISYVTGIGDQGKDCVLKLGDTYGNLVNNCIQVYKDKATDETALNKVLGNISHDDQNFSFSVVGINQNYRPASYEIGQANQFKVVPDNEVPQPADKADDLQSDVRTYGPIENDAYPITAADGSVSWHKDYHGSGAVWEEYQKLVQTRLAADWIAEFGSTAHGADGGAAVAKTLHDPTCLPGASDDPTTFRAPAGCTGFEGMVTSGPSAGATTGSGASAAASTDIFNIDTFAEAAKRNPAYGGFAGVNFGYTPGILGGGFKPGGPYVVFCSDPGNYQYCGINTPGDIYGLTGDLLGASLSRVVQIMGNGDINNVPLEGRDLRFYFKQFTIAMNKYMQSGESLKRGHNVGCKTDATGKLTCAGPDESISMAAIDAVQLDNDYLVFDSFGGGASRSEYVYAQNADMNNDPLDFEMKFLLIGSNWQSSNFYKRLDREERGFFDSLALDESQAAWGPLRNSNGKIITNNVTAANPAGFAVPNANVFLSNAFGSPAIANIGYATAEYPSTTMGANAHMQGDPIPAPAGYINPCDPSLKAQYKDAYYCATHIDPDCAAFSSFEAPQNPDGSIITRENGKPLLDGYCGIWNPTAYSLGSTSPMTIDEVHPFDQTAIVGMPNLENPYDTSSTNHPLRVLVPWKPQQEGVGYPVAADGQHDVFVETAQLDFTGQVVTPVLDYLPITSTDDAGVSTTNVSIQAVETDDFLGDIFVCVDATSAVKAGGAFPGDILAVHMYTSVQTILDWITNHPGSIDNCGLIIRYSPYNNYPDFIQSTVNGVRVNIEQGSGLGRVSDATLFVPGTGTPAGQ